ncbi:MAG: class I SAM-dependent methyltransferase [Proteobacteria bacterium]|nr:class I SAM-dependent methyltransferase [Pseudomonadota bacterium]
MTTASNISCPCCKATDSQWLGDLPGIDRFAGERLARELVGGKLYRCRNCQLKFRYPLLDAAQYDQMYATGDNAIWTGAILRPDWDLVINQIKRAGSTRRSVLDFGCHTGELLSRLDPQYRRFGVEINRTAAQVASERHHVKIWSSLDEIPGDLRFDVIVAVDVVEHMRNPKDLIDRLSNLLSESGILIVTTGDAENHFWNRFGANWWYCINPEHIAFLSEPWLSYLTRQSELSVAQCHRFRHRSLGAFRLFIHALFMFFYGLFPVTYVRISKMIKKIRSRHTEDRVLGNGVSADHLFIVLTKNFEL